MRSPKLAVSPVLAGVKEMFTSPGLMLSPQPADESVKTPVKTSAISRKSKREASANSPVTRMTRSRNKKPSSGVTTEGSMIAEKIASRVRSSKSTRSTATITAEVASMDNDITRVTRSRKRDRLSKPQESILENLTISKTRSSKPVDVNKVEDSGLARANRRRKIMVENVHDDEPEPKARKSAVIKPQKPHARTTRRGTVEIDNLQNETSKSATIEAEITPTQTKRSRKVVTEKGMGELNTVTRNSPTTHSQTRRTRRAAVETVVIENSNAGTKKSTTARTRRTCKSTMEVEIDQPKIETLSSTVQLQLSVTNKRSIPEEPEIPVRNKLKTRARKPAVVKVQTPPAQKSPVARRTRSRK